LRKYSGLQQTEEEVRRTLSEALDEATALRAEVRRLLEESKEAAAQERLAALKMAREPREQAEETLIRATKDAGAILAAAERRAEQIGGDAHSALKDKRALEEALPALWNAVEGYGDRYVMPTRSLLDDLAADFGYTKAGEMLKAARDHTRRLVETGLAATSKYEEDDRRDRANRFVVDAFNGRVDAILSRTKHDNFGTLTQEIRDAFHTVNLNGLVFHEARILPEYLEARLQELK
jgi:hypothetical protein